MSVQILVTALMMIELQAFKLRHHHHDVLSVGMVKRHCILKQISLFDVYKKTLVSGTNQGNSHLIPSETGTHRRELISDTNKCLLSSRLRIQFGYQYTAMTFHSKILRIIDKKFNRKGKTSYKI